MPEGVDWLAVKQVRDGHVQRGNFGRPSAQPWARSGVWGVMGYNATPANVELVLASFREGLRAQGKLPK